MATISTPGHINIQLTVDYLTPIGPDHALSAVFTSWAIKSCFTINHTAAINPLDM